MKPLVLVASPLFVFTKTFTAPELTELGVVNAIDVEDSTVKTAATPPILSSLAPVRLVPVSLLAYPPVFEPEVTCSETIVGAGK